MPHKPNRETRRNGYLKARSIIAAGIRMDCAAWREMGERMKAHDRKLWAAAWKWEKQND